VANIPGHRHPTTVAKWLPGVAVDHPGGHSEVRGSPGGVAAGEEQTVASSVADAMVALLKSSGVRRVYGVPGDSLNGFTDALRRNGGITWEHVRHEEAAGFAAGAEAALSGELAVCAGSCRPRGGPGPVDLGHMRWNLALDYGIQAAEQFLAIYRTLTAGAVRHHPYLGRGYRDRPDRHHRPRRHPLPSGDLAALETYVAAALAHL